MSPAAPKDFNTSINLNDANAFEREGLAQFADTMRLIAVHVGTPTFHVIHAHADTKRVTIVPVMTMLATTKAGNPHPVRDTAW